MGDNTGDNNRAPRAIVGAPAGPVWFTSVLIRWPDPPLAVVGGRIAKAVSGPRLSRRRVPQAPELARCIRIQPSTAIREWAYMGPPITKRAIATVEFVHSVRVVRRSRHRRDRHRQRCLLPCQRFHSQPAWARIIIGSAVHPPAQREGVCYNRILAEEFLYAGTWTSEAKRAEALNASYI